IVLSRSEPLPILFSPLLTPTRLTMTPRLARNQLNRVTIRRRNIASGAGIYKRRSGGMTKYLQKLMGPTRVAHPSIAASPASSWICTSDGSSWTNLKIVEMTNSEICTNEFADWTIFDEYDQCDLGNDVFLGECMRLLSVWEWCATMEDDSESSVSSHSIPSVCGSSCWCSFEAEYVTQEEEEDEEMEEEMEEEEDDSYSLTSSESIVSCDCCRLSEEEGEEEEIDQCTLEFAAMIMNDDEDEEIMVEPETHNSLLMAALLSTKELLPSPSGGALRALSCPDLLMDSLAALLFETRHLHFINERFALPSPPTWMIEAAKEMDPPNSLVTTVSLPSGWDAVSTRLSSSSIFNLFSDRPASPIPSLGVPSSSSSTVSVPFSFWDTPSITTCPHHHPISSLVSIPSTFFVPHPLTSSTSSLFIDPSEVSSSSLFMDPSSVHSSDSTGCCTYSSLTGIPSSSSLISDGICPDCGYAHGESDTEEVSAHPDSDVATDVTDDFERSRHTYIVSSPSSTSSSSSGYKTDVDSEPALLKKNTVSATTQTSGISQATAIRMLAECDSMLEKLVEMKKKLSEFL
ncbi:hypothetical protein PENTCL1PPCAC_2046, partial [Pristionchus entomophagus]